MNQFGRIFRIMISGRSHGPAISVIVDGVPAGIPINPEDFTKSLNRRKPNSRGTTKRIEADIPEILSGVYQGYSEGLPIHILLKNQNTRPSDYNDNQTIPRPGHADFSQRIKYDGFADMSGGGQSSGRMTAALVVAGDIAKKIINSVDISAKLIEAGGKDDIDKSIQNAIDKNDSIGGIVECRINGINAGLGEPFFDSIESMISHGIFSIPGAKSIEFGLGVHSARVLGSEYNDRIIDKSGKTKTNNSGGISGGLSNGNEIVFRVAFRPPASISQKQKTINIKTNEEIDITINGRHDVCYARRTPVIIESIVACVIADLLMIKKSKG